MYSTVSRRDSNAFRPNGVSRSDRERRDDRDRKDIYPAFDKRVTREDRRGPSTFPAFNRSNFPDRRPNGSFAPKKSDFDFSGPVNVKPCTFKTVKVFYDDTGCASKRSDFEVRQYHEQNHITVSGHRIIKPFIDFNDYEWPNVAYQLFRRNNFERPTPIQAQCWPIILSGRDLIGIAVTGSGKTLAFVLPAFIHIEGQRHRKDDGPMVLIMAPTRELALQIENVVNEFRYISSVCVYGGAARGAQVGRIRRERPNIIIATPGRLIDLVTEGSITLSNISYVVLDEADRMLDMGFEPQIRRVFEYIPCKDRQTLMFSATWPKEVRELAADFTLDPIHVKIGATELQANTNITQIVDVVESNDKMGRLFDLLRKINESKENKTIIFTDMKRKVDHLVRVIGGQRYRVSGIHGNKTQMQREQILRGFRESRFDILIATDVAARGLDVDDVKYVVNFDFPNSTEDYVHRIGRTGRRENKGIAYTFFTSDDRKQARQLVTVLKQTNQEVPVKLQAMAGRMYDDHSANKFTRYNVYKRPYDDSRNGPSFKRSRFD